MGIGFGYVCKKCGARKNLFYGVGFLGYKEYYLENNYKELIDLGKKDEIRNLERLLDFVNLENVDMKEGFGLEEYICTKCNCLENKFRYTLMSDKKRFYPKYSCKYCGGSMKQRKADDVFKLKCDECGSEEFEDRHFMINWD